MKLSLLFSIALVGCATAVMPDDPVPTVPAKKDAGADAKTPPHPAQQDSGVSTPDTGPVDDPSDSGGSCTLMITYGSSTCQSCMQGCCSPDNACANSSDCVALLSCLLGCQPNDSSCVSGCRSQHTTGTPLFDGITSCMGSQCSTSCP